MFQLPRLTLELPAPGGQVSVLALFSETLPNPSKVAESAGSLSAVGEIRLHVTVGIGIQAGVGFAPSGDHAISGVRRRKSLGFGAEQQQELGNTIDTSAVVQKNIGVPTVIHVLGDDRKHPSVLTGFWTAVQDRSIVAH